MTHARKTMRAIDAMASIGFEPSLSMGAAETVSMPPAGVDGERERFRAALAANMHLGGGTDLAAALDRAYGALAGHKPSGEHDHDMPANRKNIFIITDGPSPAGTEMVEDEDGTMVPRFVLTLRNLRAAGADITPTFLALAAPEGEC